ncbi:tachylectin-related carbohydrate-binding protein [Lentzea tibetensis]|nr:tachylectin-related carbohydrate-binding protein [Lentzea tibetensis]
MRKLGAAGSALAVISLSASLAVVTSSPAAADQEVRCESKARIFTVQPNGNLWLYEHANPAAGGYAWAGARHIGTDWAGGRTLAGQFGYVYSITASGDVRRFRWNGDGWDRGGAYDVIGRGWGRFATAEHRNKITVDSLGDFYSIDDQGRLSRSFVVGNELRSEVIAQGWGGYNLIAASGPGTIYARANSYLDRFRYHRDSNRLYEAVQSDTPGWPSYSKLAGAGGGIFFGVNWVHDDLNWQRDTSGNDDTHTYPPGNVAGSGWAKDIDTVVAPDTCTRVPERGPSTPSNGITSNAPSAIVESGGKLRIAHRQDNGTIRFLTEDAEGSWSSRAVGEGQYVMDISALPVNGGVQITAEHLDGARAFTVGDNGVVSPATELGGRANELPVVTQVGYSYFSAEGDLWYRYGEGPWRRKDTNIGNWGLTAITRADGVVVLVVNDRTTTEPVMFTDDHGRLSDAQPLNGPAGLDPALSLDADGTVRVTYTDVVEKTLVTRRIGGSGSQEWTTVAGPDPSYGNAAAAAAGPDGRVDIVRRASGGQVVVSTQLEPNGTAFGPWVPVGGGYSSAPAIVRSVATGQLVITFRDSANASHVYKRTASGYVGGKVG